MYVGFVGQMGSGKSFVGAKWQEVMAGQGLTVARVDIALPLKQLAANTFNVTPEFVEENKGNFRTWLQETGRLVRENIEEDWLVKEAMKAAYHEPFGYIENIRMKNEMLRCDQSSWYLIGVTCDEDIRIARLTERYGRPPTEEELNHPTEKDIPWAFEQGIMVMRNNNEEDAINIAHYLAGLAIENKEESIQAWNEYWSDIHDGADQ